jgi:hypothetical protein
MNTREAYAEDIAHTIERIRGFKPDKPARYDEARARAIAWLGCRWVFHRGGPGLGRAWPVRAALGKARGL